MITNVYPTGSVTEGSFIEPELEALRRNFDRVIVVPVFDSGERQHIPCPEVEADLSLAQPLSLLSRISRLRFLASPSVLRELPRIIRSVRGFRRCAGQCFYYMNVSYMHRKLLRWMKRRQIDPAQTLFYTFWFDFPTVALARISAECGATVVSRAHGYDVYEKRVRLLSTDFIPDLKTVSRSATSDRQSRNPTACPVQMILTAAA